MSLNEDRECNDRAHRTASVGLKPGSRAQRRAAAAFLGLFVLLVAAWLAWRHERHSQENDETRLLAEQVAYRFGREVDIHLALAAMARDRLEAQDTIDQARFQEAVSHVQRHFASFAVIAFLNPGMTPQWMVPEGSFLLGGFSLFEQPLQRELMLRSFLERRTVISPPLRGAQAAALMAAYVPVFNHGQFAGYLSPVLRLDVLLERLLKEGFLHFYMVRVADQSSGLVVFSNAMDEREFSVAGAVVTVADRRFLVQLASVKSHGWLLLPFVALPCAALLALLPALLIYQGSLHATAMYRERERFKKMADMLPEMVLELSDDEHLEITYLNSTARHAFAHESREDAEVEDSAPPNFHQIVVEQSLSVLGKKLDELRHGDPAQARPIWCDLELRRTDGTMFPGRFTAIAMRDEESNAVIGFRCVISDMTEVIKRQRDLKQAATHDTLTGLPNRGLFYDRLEQAISRARREGSRLAVLFCDLDKFKQVNDTLGHHAGDELLRQVATRMKEAVRKTDTVARLAGDEFVLIIEGLPGTGDALSMVDEVCSKIIQHLSNDYLINDTNRVTIGLSIGISIFPDHGQNVDELLISADHSMYRVKADGGNAFHMAVSC